MLPVLARVMVVTPLCDFRVTPHTECGRPTVTTLAFGCRHEHIRRSPLCAEHRDTTLAYGNAHGLYCRTCYELPAPHDHHCLVKVREEPGSTAYAVGDAAFTHVTLS